MGALAAEIAALVRGGGRSPWSPPAPSPRAWRASGPARAAGSIPEKQAAAAVGQSALMWHYEAAFKQHGAQVGQVLLTAQDIGDRARYLNARNTLLALLDLGVVPVVNENDTVAVEEIKFGDNDNLAALVARSSRPTSLVLLTDVDGLYTADPGRSRGPAARDRRGGDRGDPAPRLDAAERRRPGGMATKLAGRAEGGASGIPIVIASGARARRARARSSRGEDARAPTSRRATDRLGARKHWIAFAVPPRAGSRSTRAPSGR